MGLAKTVPWAEIHRQYPAVHLSDTDKGPKDYWRPQVPKGGYNDREGWIIEDLTTPRLCFAPTIGRAARARGDSAFYLYVPARDVELVAPNAKDTPESPGNHYGPNFYWSRFAEYFSIEPYNESKRKEALEGCVPDARQTGEMWRLKPLHVRRLGTVNFTSRTVRLD